MYRVEPNMQIMRMPVGAENPFTVTSNDENSFARDSRLSLSAKGLLFTVFTLREEDWHFSADGLSSLVKDSGGKIRSVLNELKKFGYYVVEQVKDKNGRYRPSRYCFYESSQLNDREDTVEQNGLFSSLSPDDVFPYAVKPDADSATQSNTNILNTNKRNTESVCQPGSVTDGLTETGNQENTVSEIPELEIMFTEMTGQFALQVKQYLTEIVATGKINGRKAVDAEKLMQKLWTVYKENSLSAFLKELESVCTESLKNLKHERARDNFLKSVTAEFAVKYHSESGTEKKYSEPAPDFREMLKAMQYPCCDLDSEIFDSEDSYSEYFGDDDEEELKQCVIPDSFVNHRETMEHALKFLGRFHWGMSPEHRTFADEAYRSLAKIICTGKAGKNRSVDSGILVRRLNEINADVHNDGIGISDFMQSFHSHFEDKYAEYSAASNKKAYMEVMLVSFLDGEYQELNIRANHEIAVLDRYCVEEKNRKEDCEKQYSSAEHHAESCVKAKEAETVETITESDSEEISSVVEEQPETVTEESAEETEQPELPKLTRKDGEEFFRSLGFSGEKLEWLLRDYDDEDTEEPFPEPCIDMTEDSAADTAETVTEPSETVTEQVAEQDMGILISVPETVPESDNSAADLCTITPEMRNSVIR